MTAEARERYHHGDLPNALVDEAVKLLEEGGAEAFTLRELARRVGVNHRAVYRHFEDKRALLAVVAERGYRALTAAMHQAIEETGSKDPLERLVAAASAYVVFGVNERARYEVMLGPRLNEDERFPPLEEAIKTTVRLLSAELRQVAPNVPRERIRDAGIGLLAAAHGLVALRLTRRIRIRRELLAGYTAKLLGPLVRGILADLAEPG
ncbi:MAG: TetR/AcrR family transcriptional regulator [Polyangiaceae bacterium]|nr:TetR/AcrR family transcriptional regulator [Polyangiaceae bacterium]